MDKYIEHRQSTLDMLKVRELRRRRLCEVLTYIGSSFLLIFGSMALVDGNLILAAVLLISMSLGMINISLLYLRNNIELSIGILNIIIFTLCVTLVVTGGKNDTGILWVYPLVAINLFLNRFKIAVLVYGLFLIISGSLLLTPLDQYIAIELTTTEALRFEITLLALWLICLAAIYSEESAYKAAVKLHDDDIARLALFDSLTNLPNRRLILDSLDRLIQDTKDSHHSGAIMFLDIDRFKTINDSLGHHTGDLLLTQIARRLEESIREDDSAARLGGDEFLILISELSDNPNEAQHEIIALANRIIKSLSSPFYIDGNELLTSTSIGITFFSDESQSSSELIQQADIAMYHAKDSGRNRFQFYHEELRAVADQRMDIEKTLRQILNEDSLKLRFQPQVYANGEVFSVEALLSWQDTALQGVDTNKIIAVAEDSGLISNIDDWVFKKCCELLVEWDTKLPQRKIRIAVNISARQFSKSDFYDQIDATLTETGVDPNLLELEVTESMLIGDLDSAVEKMKQLKKRGLRFSIDDFGTGYSSLRYLNEMPLDLLKIDQTFTQGLNKGGGAQAIIHSIITMAQHFSIDVIAEGVETEQQRAMLLSLGCTHFQGHLFCKPETAEVITDLLYRKTQLPIEKLSNLSDSGMEFNI